MAFVDCPDVTSMRSAVAAPCGAQTSGFTADGVKGQEWELTMVASPWLVLTRSMVVIVQGVGLNGGISSAEVCHAALSNSLPPPCHSLPPCAIV